MKNYIVIALYDEGYGGFDWRTDIKSIDNESSALRISSMVDMMDYCLCRESNADERQRIYKERVSRSYPLYTRSYVL